MKPARILKGILWSTTAAVLLFALLEYPHVDFYFAGDERIDSVTRTVTFDSEGIQLIGNILRPRTWKGTDFLPSIVLLHGTSPQGKALFLYKILSSELNKKGAIVFIYAQRGYDPSPDPPRDKNGHLKLDFVGDALRAIRFLSSQDGVDPKRITLVGHSFGGSVAIGVSHQPGIEDMLEKIVVISPGRGWPYKGQKKTVFRQKRLSNDMKLEKPLNLENVETTFQELEAETLLTRKNALPISLINGEYEEKVKPLSGIYGKMPSPRDLFILNGTGHYFHTDYFVNKLNAPIKIYRKKKIDALVDAILS